MEKTPFPEGPKNRAMTTLVAMPKIEPIIKVAKVFMLFLTKSIILFKPIIVPEYQI